MTINIEYETEKKLDLDYETIIRQVVEKAMDYEKCPYEAEVNVTLTDNAAIHEINREYREIDRATDVLSFPMIEYETPADFDALEDVMDQFPEDYFNPDTGELMLGDIVISVEKVEEQAEKYGHSKERELAFLTAHSMMHLFGYDHMEEDEAKVMEAKQREVLELLGITRFTVIYGNCPVMDGSRQFKMILKAVREMRIYEKEKKYYYCGCLCACSSRNCGGYLWDDT